MLTEIKSEIKNIMNSIDDVYNVYTEKKYIKDAENFLDLYKAENILGEKIFTAWFITRRTTAEKYFSSKENIRDHSISISGYLGISEGINSYKKFENMLEDICAAFRNSVNLNNRCLENSPVQIDKIEEKYLGSILCHYTELELICTEKIEKEI